MHRSLLGLVALTLACVPNVLNAEINAARLGGHLDSEWVVIGCHPTTKEVTVWRRDWPYVEQTVRLREGDFIPAKDGTLRFNGLADGCIATFVFRPN